MLKADFHIHTKEDPKDNINYNAKELIDYASKLNYEVLSITNHESCFFNKEIESYAKKKGILLIPGTEAEVEGKHVLLINYNSKKDPKKLSFSDVERLRKENTVVIAPHPFYPSLSCLRRKFLRNIDVFDAVEYSHYYFHPRLNFFNEKAVKIAKKNNISVIGTSDAHHLYQMEKTYSLLDCKKDKDSVLEAIRKNKVKVVTEPLAVVHFFGIFFKLMSRTIRK